MGRKTTGPDVDAVVTKAATGRTRGRGRHSALYLWLYENHDALAEKFNLTGPSWPNLAEVLGGEGILDGDGKPPTARGTRGAWSRVRDQKKREAAPLLSPPSDISPSKRSVQSPSTDARLPIASAHPSIPAPTVAPRRTFGFATPKEK